MSPLRFIPASPHTVITDIASPELSLRQVAEKHGTSLEALTLWLSRDDTQAQISAVNELHAFVARTAAIAFSRRAVAAISTAIDEATALLDITPRPTREEIAAERESPRINAAARPASNRTPNAPNPSSTIHPTSLRRPHSPLALLEFRRRLSDSIRIGGTALLRMTRFSPGLPARGREEPKPAPQRAAASASQPAQPAPAAPSPTRHATTPHNSAPVADAPERHPAAQPSRDVIHIPTATIPPHVSPVPTTIEHTPHAISPTARPRAPAASLLAAAGRAS